MDNNDRISALEATVEELKADVERLTKTVYVGNGSPSLVAQVGAIAAQVGTISKLLWVAVSASVGTLLKMFFG